MTLHARRGYAQALLAVSLFSTSPVLIRWASGVNPVEITFWRLFLATLTVVLFAALTRQPVRWRALPHRRFALYGVVIALHFFLYVASLSFTSVAHSLALVYTAPLLIALLSAVFLHESLTLRKWLGVSVGVLGVAILAGFEPQTTPRMVAGDLLALGSSATFAIYSVIEIGRA